MYLSHTSCPLCMTNFTRFLLRALFLPFLFGFMGEDNLGGTTLQSSSQMQLQHCAKSSDELDLEYSSESTVVNNTECILISRIRATNVAVDMRHIPVWFYVAVGSGSVIKRTSNEPVSAGGDMVEWDDEIVLISLTVFASFELGPTLREGEVLRKFEITVGELLDCDGQLERIGSLEHDGEEAIPPSLSLEIEIKRPICSQNKYAAASNVSRLNSLDVESILTFSLATGLRGTAPARGVDK
ncbi:hypothetical protein OG21DRAFT_211197 [Imleria badia]|nr:hypothetical protein OG21DRAFT_211197 [Imleria badia]